MTMKFKVTGLLVTVALALPIAGRADTQTTHRVHKTAKRETVPAPLPSGTRGPIPQVPLDSIPPIQPQVTFQDGLLTIVAPNSTLGDILRGVRKHTSADIEIPPTASERVVTHLGPAPAREVMAELLNGSRFNYILLGSPENANELVKVVLVARTGPETQSPANAAPDGSPSPAVAEPAEAPDPETAEDNSEENTDQNAEAEQTPPAEQPGTKTPQQMLQEMQQRQLMMQQQQQLGQPGAFPPGMPNPRLQQPQQPNQEQ
jgi:hypothetical protein